MSPQGMDTTHSRIFPQDPVENCAVPFKERLAKLKTNLQQQIPTVFEDQFSEEVWASTYKDSDDVTINDTMFRVASAAASVEKTDDLKLEWTAKFYDLLSQFKGTAGGRIYANAGTTWGGTTLMNCYVGPRVPHDVDSLDGILTHLRAQAHTLKSEGGWGENFSYIRPRGAFIHGIGVETPGAVKYMELFDKSSEIITSGSGKKSANKKAKGKIRKGAMMGVMDVWHPDIIEFITAKQQPGRLTKFNVSVNCTDDFMQRVNEIIQIDKETAVELGFDQPRTETLEGLQEQRAMLDNWDLIFPETDHPKYKSDWKGDIQAWQKKGYPVKVYQTVSVMWLWNLIMDSTYSRAEPGVLFLDRANHFLPLN
jgi:ribonucleoside-diphosphate reductase alpha chain